MVDNDDGLSNQLFATLSDWEDCLKDTSLSDYQCPTFPKPPSPSI